MSKLLSLLGILLLPVFSGAQVSTFYTIYGTSQTDNLNSAIKTSDGGFIMAGNTDGSGAGNIDMFVVKTDSLGNTLWKKTYGDAYLNEAVDIVEALNGDFVIVGLSRDSLSNSSTLIVRIDNTGNLVWAKDYSGSIENLGSGIARAGDSGFIFSGITMLGPGPSGTENGSLAKIDSLGNIVWSKVISYANKNTGLLKIINVGNDFVVTGGTNVTGVDQALLLRADANGNLTWRNIYTAPSLSYARDIIQTLDGGFAFCGAYYNNNNGFDYDMYVAKTDSTGTMLWNNTYGKLNIDEAYSIIQLADSNFVVTGNFGSATQQASIFKLDPSNGDTLFAKLYGGAAQDYGKKIFVMPDQGFVVADITSQGFTNNNFGLFKTDQYGESPCMQDYYTGALQMAPITVNTTSSGSFSNITYTVQSPVLQTGNGGSTLSVCGNILGTNPGENEALKTDFAPNPFGETTTLYLYYPALHNNMRPQSFLKMPFNLSCLQPGDRKGELILLNMFGEEVKRIALLGQETIMLSAENLPAGIYAYRIVSGGKLITAGKVVAVH